LIQNNGAGKMAIATNNQEIITKKIRLSIHESPPFQTAYFEEDGESMVKMKQDDFEFFLKLHRVTKRLNIIAIILAISFAFLTTWLLLNPSEEIKIIDMSQFQEVINETEPL
jgi:hypothetical protein